MKSAKVEKGYLIREKARIRGSRLSIKPGQERGRTYLRFFSMECPQIKLN
jgi:hypothetical protein